MANSILDEDDEYDNDYEEVSEYDEKYEEESSETVEEVSEYNENYEELSETDEMLKINPKNGLFVSDKELKELEEDSRKVKESNVRKMLFLYFLCGLAIILSNLVAIMILKK